MSRIYNWWLSSNTYTVSQLRIQEMDKAPKAVILMGEDSGEGSEIHPYSKFLDPSCCALPEIKSWLRRCLHVMSLVPITK